MTSIASTPSAPIDPEAPPIDLDDALLPVIPLEHPPAHEDMLRLIAYDIASPKRLKRIADILEDHGVRVQYSLFELWLEEPHFQELWSQLVGAIDPKKDRIAAYSLDRDNAQRRLPAGAGMIFTQPSKIYIA